MDFFSELERQLEKMTPRTRIYSVIKRHLTERGYWRNLPRGNSRAGYKAQQGLLGQAKQTQEWD